MRINWSESKNSLRQIFALVPIYAWSECRKALCTGTLATQATLYRIINWSHTCSMAFIWMAQKSGFIWRLLNKGFTVCSHSSVDSEIINMEAVIKLTLLFLQSGPHWWSKCDYCSVVCPQKEFAGSCTVLYRHFKGNSPDMEEGINIKFSDVILISLIWELVILPITSQDNLQISFVNFLFCTGSLWTRGAQLEREFRMLLDKKRWITQTVHCLE